MSEGRPITEDDLHAYVDGALEAARRTEIEDYLQRHPEVAQRIRGYAAQRDHLREALAPIAEEPIPAELNLAKLIEAQRRPHGSSTLRTLHPSQWWLAAAAALILGLGGGAGGWFLRGASLAPRAGVASLVQEAADSYEVYGPDHVRPVELRAADTAQLVGWVSQRLQHPIAVPDLAASGYRFMGGRLVPTPHGPAGLFMYDDDRGTRLVMLVRPMTIEQNAPMSQHARGSVSGIAWSNKGIGYTLVGPTSPEILHPLANEIRKQVGTEI